MAGSPAGRRCAICGSENHPTRWSPPGYADRWWVGFAVLLTMAVGVGLLVVSLGRAL